jgi:membrane fusion protein (multidrug efflux system)
MKVDTGIRQNGRVEILGGVKAGQTVVTDGVVKLTDGVPVRLPGANKSGANKSGANRPGENGPEAKSASADRAAG